MLEISLATEIKKEGWHETCPQDYEHFQ